MNTTFVLYKRNVKLFFRDRSAVGFSLLGSFILLTLNLLVFSKMQADNLAQLIPNADEEAIDAYVYLWSLGGLAIITLINSGLGSLGVYINDKSHKTYRDFLVTPANNNQLLLGYLFASATVSFIMSAIILAFGFTFAAIRDIQIISIGEIAVLLIVVAFLCLIFSAISSFAVSLVKSNSAFAGLSTIYGTLTGFMTFSYIPQAALTDTVVSIFNALPFAQGAMLLREAIASEAAMKLSNNNEDLYKVLSDSYGIETSYIGDFDLGSPLVYYFLVIYGAIFAIFAIIRIRKSLSAS